MVFMKNRKLIWRGIVVDENFQINNDDAKCNWCKKEIKNDFYLFHRMVHCVKCYKIYVKNK